MNGIEQFEQLTDFQQELVNGLITEFTKINPKPTNGASRFTLQTIKDCLQEKDRFKDTVAKHNLAMMEALVSQFKSEIQEFEKEFGEVLTVELGYKLPQNPNTRHKTLEAMVEATRKQPLSENSFFETNLSFVSKTKAYKGDAHFDYFKGKSYHQIYVDFARELVRKKLESGEITSAYKIIGLNYYTIDSSYRKTRNYEQFKTLDDFVQNHQPTQQKLVELAKQNPPNSPSQTH